MKARRLLTTFAFTLFTFLWCINTYGAAGDPDPNFDGDGKVITIFANGATIARAVAIQVDGKIVVAGSGGTAVDFVVVRYNPDGSLDTTFSIDGIANIDFGNVDRAFGVGIQNDGKIVVAGETNGNGNFDLAVARFNSNGTIDSGFGQNGKVTVDFLGSTERGFGGVIIQPDGKIILAGSAQDALFQADFALVRLNSNGSLDSTFSFDGKLTTDLGSDLDTIIDLVLQPDNKIIAVGFSNIGGQSDMAIARYNSDGQLDNTFDADGRVTTDINANNDFANSVALQTDGKIVTAGFAFTGGANQFTLVRYNTNGSIDTSFDLDGVVLTNFGANVNAGQSIVIQNNGSILVAGESRAAGTSDFALARYLPDGSLDTSFSLDGKVLTDFEGREEAGLAMALQSDGRIVVAGREGPDSTGEKIAVARYDGDPPPSGIFADDYEDGVLATDWTYVKPNWTESAGNLIGTPTGKTAEAIATPAFAGCVVCTMQASIQTSGGDSNKIWFLTWFEDKRNTLEVLMKEENDRWILRQRVNGKIVAKTKGLATILPNTFYDVKVSFDGVNFVLVVDGVSLATLPAFTAPAGTLGFRVKNTVGTFGFVAVN